MQVLDLRQVEQIMAKIRFIGPGVQTQDTGAIQVHGRR